MFRLNDRLNVGNILYKPFNSALYFQGLKDEGIDSSSDDETSASTVSSSEKSCSSSDSSDDIPDPKPRRFRKNNKLKSSMTVSDIPRHQDAFPRKIQLPAANEFKDRLTQANNPDVKIPMLAKLGRKPSIEAKIDDESRLIRVVKEPVQLGKLRRPVDKGLCLEESPPPMMKISQLNQAAKAKFFGVTEPEKKAKTVDELAACVRKFIAPVSSYLIDRQQISCVFFSLFTVICKPP